MGAPSRDVYYGNPERKQSCSGVSKRRQRPQAAQREQQQPQPQHQAAQREQQQPPRKRGSRGHGPKYQARREQRREIRAQNQHLRPAVPMAAQPAPLNSTKKTRDEHYIQQSIKMMMQEMCI